MRNPFRQSAVLAIGNNAYRDGIPQLTTAVADAREFALLLRDKHDFRERLLTGKVTRDDVLDALGELAKEMREEDRLVFYFAGHGIATVEEKGPAGYLLLSDAIKGQPETFLSMSGLQQRLDEFRCRHALVILDCCFAGAFRLSSTRTFEAASDVLFEEQFEAYRRGTVWQLLVSAAEDERALDRLLDRGTEAGSQSRHSPFAAALIEGLSGAADLYPAAKDGGKPGDGVITSGELFVYLYQRITDAKLLIRQTPGLWPMPRHTKGQFFFLTPGRDDTALPNAVELSTKNNPYRGLEFFDESDRELFYGRAAAVLKLAIMVRHKPFVVVAGPSGAGKSSLVLAGVLPALKTDFHVIRPVAPNRSIRPGPNPFLSLAAALAADQPGKLKPEEVERKLRTEPGSLARFFETKTTSCCGVVLVIDQLEELISFGVSPQDRETFLREIAGVNDSTSVAAVHVVATVRAEFEPALRIDAIAGVWDAGRFVIPAMSREEMRECVVRPAEKRALFFEPADLVERLLDEVVQMPGALPLLSFTLSELYTACVRAQRVSRALTEDDFKTLGGVIGSVQERATDEWSALSTEERESLRRVLLRMISLEAGTVARRRTPRRELEYNDPGESARVEKVTRRFEEGRLLTSGDDPVVGPYLEPAHEALITGWGKIAEWRAEFAKKMGADLALHRRVAQASAEWSATRTRELLWDDDPRLEQVRQWPALDRFLFNKTESSFISASIKRRRFRRRAVAGITAVVLIASIAISVTLYTQQQRAIHLRMQSIAQNLVSSGSVQQMEAGQDETGALLLRQAYLIDRQYPGNATAPLDAALRNSLTAPYFAARLKYGIGTSNAVAFDETGKWLAVGTDNALVYLFDVTHPNQSPAMLEGYDRAGTDGGIHTIAFCGSDVVMATRKDGILRRYDVHSAGSSKDLFRAGSELFGLAWSPRRKLLAVGDQNGNIWIRTLTEWESMTATDSGRVKRTSQSSPVRALAFSEDGEYLASAHRDGVVRLWKAAQQYRKPVLLPGRALLQEAPDLPETVEMRGVAFSPDGQTLAAASEDFHVYLWDVKAPQRAPKRLAGHSSSVLAVGFSPDSKLLYSASDDNRLGIWTYHDPNLAPRLIARQKAQAVSIAVAPKGDLLATGGTGGEFVLWDAGRHTLRESAFTVEGDPSSISISEDGSLMAVADRPGRFSIYGADGESWTKRSDLLTPVQRGAPEDFDGAHGAISRDGSVAAGCAGSTARVWLIGAGETEPVELPEFRGTCRAMALDDRARTIVGSNSDGAVSLWTLEGRAARFHSSFKPSDNYVAHVAFLPGSGDFLALQDYGTLQLFRSGDLRSPIRLIELSGLSKGISSSKDGSVIAAATTDEIAIWTNASHRTQDAKWFAKPAYRAAIGSDSLESLSVSADGANVAIGLESGLVRIFDTAHLDAAPIEIRANEKFDTAIVAFRPSRPLLAIGTANAQIRFLSIGLDALAERICTRVWTNLSQPQWNQLVGPDLTYEKTCPGLPPGPGAPGADDRFEPWKHLPNPSKLQSHDNAK